MNAEAKKKLLLAKRRKVILSQESATGSGSTLLNLACTDRHDLAYVKGKYYFLVGDSGGGKTFLLHNIAAEVCANPAFKDYEIIYDDVEGGANFDIEKFWGAQAAKRIKAPRYKNGVPVCSEKIEDFYHTIMTLIEEGKKFIYFLDSQDALDSLSAEKKFRKQRKQHEDDEEVKGSYGDGKAKYHSEHLRAVISGIKRTGSILFLVGQTRDNLGFSFDPKTRSGGKALRFYATLEMWTSIKGSIKRTVNGKEKTIGVKVLVEVRKNRFTGKIGKDRAVVIPIYHSYGLDDIGSCVDFLIDEQHWDEIDPPADAKEGKRGKKKKYYDARELMFEGTRDKIIAHVEEEDLEEKLRQLVAKVWQEIEDKCAINRKKRYV